MITLLNLGCGTRVSDKPGVTNIDWSFYLRMKKNVFLRSLAPVALRGVRRERFRSLPDNILCHNLAKGIPFADGSVDVVYHSHLLEHLERKTAYVFLKEVKRVLKPGGIHRIAVPDLEMACREYLEHVNKCTQNPEEAERHEEWIEPIIEQCVRREGAGAAAQTPVRRFLDNLILGDARKRGEVHQWMYDRVNLSQALMQCGFNSPSVKAHNESEIPDWVCYGLDTNRDGSAYKPDSLYIEARR